MAGILMQMVSSTNQNYLDKGSVDTITIKLILNNKSANV